MKATITVSITVENDPGKNHRVEIHHREITAMFSDNPNFVAHELSKVAPDVLRDVVTDFGDPDWPDKQRAERAVTLTGRHIDGGPQ